MSVTNRKMFKRDARDKVRQMGGIMASSEPLIQEVARFQPGGSVNTRDYFQSLMKSSRFGGGQQLSEETLDFLKKRFGKQMPSYNKNVDTGVDSDTRFILGKDKGEGLAGIPFIRAPQQNVNVASRRKEIPALLAEREQLVQEQRARKILGLAKRAGFNLNTPIRNKDEVIKFINQVDPSFNLTRQSFDKLFGAESDPTIATKAGPTLGNILRSLFLLPTAATLDVGKGIGEALFGDTKAYNKDELRKLISGEMKPVAGEKINLADAALDLYQRETSGPFAKDSKEVAQDIKNISGFDVNAMAAMKMRKAGDPSGVLGVLTGEGSGIQVKDPEGFKRDELGPFFVDGSEKEFDLERFQKEQAEKEAKDKEQEDFRKEEAILSGRSPLDSRAAEIQAQLRFRDKEAKIKEMRGGMQDASEDQEEGKYEKPPTTAEEREAFKAEDTKEIRNEQDQSAQYNAAELSKKVANGEANINEVKKQVSDVVKSGAGVNGALKQLMKEFTDNAPEYKGLDRGLAIAKIGFAMAAGESPNAITNIAKALSDGADMFIEDNAKRDAFNRQVQLSALQYGLGEVSKQRAQARTDARTRTDFAVGDKPIQWKGTTYQPGETISISNKDYFDNGGKLPAGLQTMTMYTSNQAALNARLKNASTIAAKNLEMKTMKISDQKKFVDDFAGLHGKASKAETAGTLIESVIKRAPDVVGFKAAGKSAGAMFAAAFGFDAPKGWSTRDLTIQDLSAALQSVIPSTLGETQSANSISDRDVSLLIRAFISGGIITSKGDEPSIFNFAFTTQEKFINSLQNGLREVRRSQAQSIREMTAIENQMLELLTPGGNIGTSALDPIKGTGIFAPGGTGAEGFVLGSMKEADDGIWDIIV